MAHFHIHLLKVEKNDSWLKTSVICDLTAGLEAGPAAILSIHQRDAHTVSMKACRLQADLAPHSVSGAQNTRSDS